MFQNQFGNKIKSGMGTIEMVIVIFILALSLTSLLGMVAFFWKSLNFTKQAILADQIAKETIEAVRNFRDNTNWNQNGLGTITTGISYFPRKINENGLKWQLIQGEEKIDIFTRKVIFEKVYRDGNNNIAESGTEDPNTKKVIVIVAWQERGKPNQLQIITYLTNWKQ